MARGAIVDFDDVPLVFDETLARGVLLQEVASFPGSPVGKRNSLGTRL